MASKPYIGSMLELFHCSCCTGICHGKKHGEEGCSASGSGSRLLLLRCDEVRGFGPRVHDHQPVQDGHLAGGDSGGELRRQRFRAPPWAVRRVHRPRGVVGPRVGTHRMRFRLGRERYMLLQWHAHYMLLLGDRVPDDEGRSVVEEDTAMT